MTRDVRVVAEIGQAKGSLDYVTHAVEVCAAAGAWGVKVQLLRPEAIAQADAGLYWQDTRPDVGDQRASFARAGCLPYDAEALGKLVTHARSLGVELFATPFDGTAIGVMFRAGMQWCKIASGDITNEPLVKAAAAAFPNRLIVSTGAAGYREIDQMCRWVAQQSPHGLGPAYLLACSLAYPTPDEHAEIGRIHEIRAGWPLTNVGYSDHTHGTCAAAVAVGAGAWMLEKHVTLDSSDRDVPDNAFALLPPELGYYVDEARCAAQMLGTGDLGTTDVELAARLGASRSLCAGRDLPAGHVVEAGDVVALRPARTFAFAADEMALLDGCTLLEPVAAGCVIPRVAVKGS